MGMTKRYLMNGLTSATLLLATIPFSSSASDALSHDNIVKSHGTVIGVVDSTRFTMKIDNPDEFERMRSAASGNRDRLSYFDEKRQTIEVRMSHVSFPSATRQETAFTTLRGMQVSAAIRNFSMGYSGYMQCAGWEASGRALCGVYVYNEEFPDNGMDVGGWALHKGYGRYARETMGPHPVYDHEYTVLQSRLD